MAQELALYLKRKAKSIKILTGITEITVDAEKGLLTLIGDVDPVIVVEKLKKIKKVVKIDSVGPYKKEEPKPKEPEKPKPKEPEPCKPLPSCCNACRPIAIGYVTYDEPNFCTIL